MRACDGARTAVESADVVADRGVLAEGEAVADEQDLHRQGVGKRRRCAEAREGDRRGGSNGAVS